jgi:hypothetical protein
MADDYSPLYTGDQLVPLTVQFSNKDGTAINLTGATLTLVMESSTGTRQIGTGTWTIDNASAGQAHYAWSSADVAQAGTWTIQVSLTIGNQVQHCDPKLLTIVPPL